MPYIQVDIDIDDIEIEDIAEYLLRKKKSHRKNDKQRIKDLLDELGIPSYSISNNTSKVDVWKDELWPQIKEKFTLEQLEAFLNS